ncbi:MAG: alanine--tRNA ligase, partial [Steroidobacteraceae bacterium]
RFGDYIKLEAIKFAWEIETTKDWLGIEPQRLKVTVYHTEDEAFAIWNKVAGVPAERIVRIGDKPKGGSDNFWQMGDTGPCGPCTEIFYDHGAHIPGGPPGSPDEDGDRWIEIWNVVFMQYERDASGQLTPLPKPSVDTGMGLERVAAVMQGVHSNYEIDVFQGLISAAAEVTGTKDLRSSSLRVIADHIRAGSFLIADGVLPSNEGRGYVLRRIIRRAIRHGYQLGQSAPFLHLLVAALGKEMGAAYPELMQQRAHVERVLKQEEDRFAETLTQGMSLLDATIKGLANKVIPGDAVFKLYDTYGFPMDLTADIARERGLTIDEAGFDSAMAAQRERARAASKFGVNQQTAINLDSKTQFSGYAAEQDQGTVVALIRDGQQVNRLGVDEVGQVVLDRTPFYAESGGQVGDAGELFTGAKKFVVSDTQKLGGAFTHIGRVQAGEIKLGDALTAQVDHARRSATRLNHSATHLLHAALRVILGDHVTQKGSLVTAERLRFDFSHYSAVTAEELQKIEQLVNEQVRANASIETRLMDQQAAVAAGAMALFGEKYDSEVRVLRIGEFSMELCGGTHADRAGDIGLFKIVSEGGVAAGVRRIEAVTGQGALNWVTDTERLLREVASLLKGGRDDVADKARQLLERGRKLDKELAQLKSKLASGQGTDLSAAAVDVGGIKLVAQLLAGADVAALRSAVDQLKDKLKSAVIVLGSVDTQGKVLLIVGVTPDQVARVKAGDLANFVAQQVGGRGGGRPDMAQAGGTDADQLPIALESVAGWLEPRLK